MPQESKRTGEERVAFDPDPKTIWTPILEAANRRFNLEIGQDKGFISPNQERALSLRKWSLVIVDAIGALNADPDTISADALLEADRSFRNGMFQIRTAMPRPVDFNEDDLSEAPSEPPLDTPLRIAEYVAGRLLNVSGKNLPDVGQVKGPADYLGADYDEQEANTDMLALIAAARYYLVGSFNVEEEQEFALSEQQIHDNSQRLWKDLSIIILSDSDLTRMATENLIMAIQDPAAEVNQLGITRQYPKKDGGSFILGISVVGIELMELGNDGETLGTAIVLGPGLTNGSLGYVPGEKDDREFVPDTNLTLKAIEQKISAFKLCLSGSL